MRKDGYNILAEREESHWWFVSRRGLIENQVSIAACELAERVNRKLEILDFGCGTGFNIKMLSQFGTVTVADSNPELVKDYFKGGGIKLLEVDEEFWHRRESFDIITALDVIEHIDNDLSIIRRLLSLIRPGGQLLVTVPAYQWLWGGEDVISEHKRRYTRKGLRSVFKSAGVREYFCSYFNLTILPMMACVIWWRRMLSSTEEPKSNVRNSGKIINALLTMITGVENRSIGRQKLCLPAGSSIVFRGGRIDRG